MTNEMTRTGASADLIQFDDDKVALIKRTIAPKATDDELELFLHQCRRTGLDPLAKQIYFQKYNTKKGPKVSIITGIDGYRLVADRTGVYAGSDEPRYEGRVEQKRYQDSKQVPVKATVTVYKIVGGKRVPFSASAYWDEYYPGDKMGHMWFQMPHVMLGKVAEAQALRKAFPADLSGVYTREEMDQAGWEDVADTDKTPGPTDDDTVEIVDGAVVEETTDNATWQAQQEREHKRPSRNGDSAPEEVDHMQAALNATSLKEFAEHACHVIDGYDSPQHIVATMTKKLYPDGFVYDASKNNVYMSALADRKAEAA